MAHFKLNWIRPVNKEILRINAPFWKNVQKIILIFNNYKAASELLMIFIEIFMFFWNFSKDIWLGKLK